MRKSSRKDISGLKFSRLTAIRESHRNNSGNWIWIFRCDCGTEKEFSKGLVCSGHTRSCGCLARELTIQRNFKNGLTHLESSRAWYKIKERCLNPEHSEFHNYGARGISICERWMSLENFHEDIGRFWEKGLSLDRIDNDKGYEPGNCRWTTDEVQSNNRRNNRWETAFGMTKTWAQWSNYFGVHRNYVNAKMRGGWTIEEVHAKLHGLQMPDVDYGLRRKRKDAHRRIVQQQKEERSEFLSRKEHLCELRRSKCPH